MNGLFKNTTSLYIHFFNYASVSQSQWTAGLDDCVLVSRYFKLIFYWGFYTNNSSQLEIPNIIFFYT